MPGDRSAIRGGNGANAVRNSGAQARGITRAAATDDGRVPVVVIRKRIRNMYLRVKGEDAHLEVTAPMRVSDADILRFVDSRSQWVARVRARVLSAQDREGSGVGEWSEERKERAKEIMTERVSRLLPHWTEVVGRTPTAITYRVMTSRWGSCTISTGRIRLNLVLAEMPEGFTQYVLVHELTHLWEHGHGPRFRARMDRYLPDWREWRRRINQRVIV